LKTDRRYADGATFKRSAEASDWSDVMAKVIEFHLRGPVPKKVKPAPASLDVFEDINVRSYGNGI
jgi:hypothetical protein